MRDGVRTMRHQPFHPSEWVTGRIGAPAYAPHTVPVQRSPRVRRGCSGRVGVAAVAVGAVLLGLAPAALADDSGTGDPPAATATPTPTPEPSSASPTPSPTTGQSTPSTRPTAPAGGATPTPRPHTSPPRSPRAPGSDRDADGEPKLPEPGTDGVLPDFGVQDAYWDTFRLLQVQQRAVDAAQARLDAAEAVVAAARAERDAMVVSWGSSQALATASRLELDRLASHLYQFGSPVTAVTAMLGAPEDFLSQVDSQENEDLAAALVVSQATSDDARAALARAVAMGAGTRLQVAEQGAAAARETLAAAQRQLARTAKSLDGLAGAAPQTAIGPDGCPRRDVAGTLRGGAESVGARRLCRSAVAAAATPQAALAITWAFAHLGSAYACGGAGRMLAWRMDCSSLVSRAYHEGAGLRTAGDTWAPSTRDMVPWGGASLDPHYALVAPGKLRPGDLVLYDTGGATYRHVAMYLGPSGKGGTHWMLHTNSCGDVAKVEPFWGFPSSGSHTFLVARRVVRLPSDPPAPKATKHGKAPGSSR